MSAKLILELLKEGEFKQFTINLIDGTPIQIKTIEDIIPCPDMKTVEYFAVTVHVEGGAKRYRFTPNAISSVCFDEIL